MRRRDLRSVLRIEAQEPHRGWSVGLYLAELRRTRPAGGDRSYLVARCGGRVTGFAGALFQSPDVHITTIAVDRDARRGGIGTRLLLVVVRQALAAGVTNATLEVRAGNDAALALYRRFGFEPAGIRRAYYADTGEDAVVMWATDLDRDDQRARRAGIEAGLAGETIIEGLDL
jgi:[ribosomal protein S18]-alanine N-acetyltransferase